MTSAYRRVWININCLTDHHQPNPPQSLQRLAGTDVWYWQTELSGAWRGSYCFIPCFDERPPAFSGDDAHANMHNLRHWWHQVFASATPICSTRIAPGKAPAATASPACTCRMRRRSRYGVRSTSMRSPAALHAAAAGAFAAPYLAERAPGQQPRRLDLHHRRQQAGRASVGYPARRSVLGEADAGLGAADAADPRGALPEAVYVLIDIIDLPHRARELTCKDDFWLAVQEELMPQLADWAPHSDKPADTVVAGQSFGGLASCMPGCAGRSASAR